MLLDIPVIADIVAIREREGNYSLMKIWEDKIEENWTSLQGRWVCLDQGLWPKEGKS